MARELLPDMRLLGVAFLWLMTVFLQRSTAHFPHLNGLMMDLGFFVLPYCLAVFSLWVWFRAHDVLARVWAERRSRRIWAFAAAAYFLMYAYTTNLLAPPDADTPVSKAHPAFIIVYHAYAALAMWPNIEFWTPSLNLVGMLSVGTVMLGGVLAALMGANVALGVRALRLRRRGKLQGGGVLTAAGSTILTFGTSYCCCCVPVIGSLLGSVLGVGALQGLDTIMANPGGIWFNVVQVGTLALLSTGLVSVAKSCRLLVTGIG